MRLQTARRVFLDGAAALAAVPLVLVSPWPGPYFCAVLPLAACSLARCEARASPALAPASAVDTSPRTGFKALGARVVAAMLAAWMLGLALDSIQQLGALLVWAAVMALLPGVHASEQHLLAVAAGAWVGALAAPLDWGAPWQRFPVASLVCAAVADALFRTAASCARARVR